MNRNFILFTTDLFVYDQDDADIDRWFVGGDCCAWIYMRLLLQEHIEPGFPPVMEDWGWIFAVTANKIPVTVCTWSFLIDKCWLMGLQARKRRIFRYPEKERIFAHNIVADGIDLIINNDNRFTQSKWMEDNPFDTDIEVFPS